MLAVGPCGWAVALDPAEPDRGRSTGDHRVLVFAVRHLPTQEPGRAIRVPGRRLDRRTSTGRRAHPFGRRTSHRQAQRSRPHQAQSRTRRAIGRRDPHPSRQRRSRAHLGGPPAGERNCHGRAEPQRARGPHAAAGATAPAVDPRATGRAGERQKSAGWMALPVVRLLCLRSPNGRLSRCQGHPIGNPLSVSGSRPPVDVRLGECHEPARLLVPELELDGTKAVSG
jgi:hypothetical protein